MDFAAYNVASHLVEEVDVFEMRWPTSEIKHCGKPWIFCETVAWI